MNTIQNVMLPTPKFITRSTRMDQSTCQCDACSPIVSAEARQYCMNSDQTLRLQMHPRIVEQRIDSEHFAAATPVSDALSVYNESSRDILHFFQSRKANHCLPGTWYEQWGEQHVNSIINQMVSAGLLIDLSSDVPVYEEKSEILAVWLHVTDRCNLRCSYCYLPHKNADMSVETGLAAIASTFRSAAIHQYKQIKIKYAGGEPLLKFPLLKQLHAHANSLAQETGIQLDGVILSNGTNLTPEMIAEIKQLGMRLMISLDGIDQYHDQQRHYATGKGTVNDVLTSIETAIEMDLIPDLSVTVTGQSADGLARLIEWILKKGIPFTLNFYRENDCSKHLSELKLEEKKIIDGILAAYKVIEANIPRKSLLASLTDRANLSVSHLRTCSVGHSYMVFDHLGQVSKCQMQKDKPVARITDADPLGVVRTDTAGIQNLSVEEKEGCRTCEWKYWCAGGCPLTTFRATGRYDIKSPDCNIYKAIYPAAMRLEGLRLLKYFNNKA